MKPQKRSNLTRKQFLILSVIGLLFLIVISFALLSPKSSSNNNNEAKVTTKVPKEYKQALKHAKNYSNVMYMSKAEISKQLKSSYSINATKYALKHLKVDYNQNALKKAQEYAESQNMSQQAIHNQLITKNTFSVKQAQYAVDNLKADFNYNALVTAKKYQRDLGFSPAKIREVLISDDNESFTPAQADYAIEHLND
ncbi:Ltp family lipoprotein [Companilactobacillus nantensis]|uniref:Ltp family lipoprotein n=1 Tax=Companilactobacillus nantensis TaxID=305793 RepID=UPI0007110AFD|nr:Ltp family lipoprotein [Companilactobacillus nantensis]GEO65138.1 hypothetical protein LNA01_23210 [Companilactobacillus nantensis]